MSDPLQWMLPAPQPQVEVFAVYQATHDFHREVQYRAALEEYCDWYAQTAATHQRELEKMRHDINVFGWFSGRSH